MKILKIITDILRLTLSFLKPKTRFFELTIDKKNGSNHITVKTTYSEGISTKPLNDINTTYLK